MIVNNYFVQIIILQYHSILYIVFHKEFSHYSKISFGKQRKETIQWTHQYYQQNVNITSDTNTVLQKTMVESKNLRVTVTHRRKAVLLLQCSSIIWLNLQTSNILCVITLGKHFTQLQATIFSTSKNASWFKKV